MRGSTTAIVRPNGTLTTGYSYDEFGALEQTGATDFLNDVTFTGSVSDMSSGLQYMNSRFYNPSTGRFLSQDTYGGNPYDPWTQHLYAYTGNNPTNFIDPTGHRYQYVNGRKQWVDDNPGEEDYYDYMFRQQAEKVLANEHFNQGGDYFELNWMLDDDKWSDSIYYLKLSLGNGKDPASIYNTNEMTTLQGVIGAPMSGIWDPATLQTLIQLSDNFQSGDYLDNRGLTAGDIEQYSKLIKTHFTPLKLAAAYWAEGATMLAMTKIGDLNGKVSCGTYGSTGRTTPNNLYEQITMKAVRANPLDGATVAGLTMVDPRWPASRGWQKMQRVFKTSVGKIVIHFNYNKKTGAFDDFKFKP